jgi:hypothetical protein
MRHGPSEPTLHALDIIHHRIDLPADKTSSVLGAMVKLRCAANLRPCKCRRCMVATKSHRKTVACRFSGVVPSSASVGINRFSPAIALIQSSNGLMHYLSIRLDRVLRMKIAADRRLTRSRRAVPRRFRPSRHLDFRKRTDTEQSQWESGI